MVITSNKSKVSEVKQSYLEMCEASNVPLENIRLFCLGKELKDDMNLYHYDVVNDVVMQAMIKA